MHSTLGGPGWYPTVAHSSAEASFKGCIAMRGRRLLHRSCRLSFCWEARQVRGKPDCGSQTTRVGPYREHVLLHVSCPGDACSQVGFCASRSAERQGALPLAWGLHQLAGLCASVVLVQQDLTSAAPDVQVRLPRAWCPEGAHRGFGRGQAAWCRG